jgi:hypothetical protein
MAQIIVVGASLVMVVIVVVVLARQGSPASLSEQEGSPSRSSDVVGRPAGPGAEAMGVDDAGGSTTAPEQTELP